MKTVGLPPLFLEEMGALLGAAYPDFLATCTQPPTMGLRVNTLKISPQRLQASIPFDLNPIPWCSSGFQIRPEPDAERWSPGRHPYHAAGLYYLQEPSAMAVAELLDPQPGERVLDLCAAPGGKTTHLAALMKGHGLLLANEIHPTRVWELAENLERWGVRNAVITNETPARLAGCLEGFFDKILVDAPCSGEGMFRRSEAARRDWSPTLVASCAVRQTTILELAVRMLKPGGSLAYSTCTFNPHENEQVIRRLLDDFPDFEIVAPPVLPGTSPGWPAWTGSPEDCPELAKAVRIWPHQAPGEGHFAALLRKNPAGSSGRKFAAPSADTRRKAAVPSQASQSYQEFCQRNLMAELISPEFDQNRLRIEGSYLYRLPEELPDMSRLRVIHPGWWLGSFRAGKRDSELRFTPSHALAMGLNPSQALRSLDLEQKNPQTRAYLHGEMLPWDEEDGWVLVMVDGYPVGWGRATGGRLKNYYPRGLRRS